MSIFLGIDGGGSKTSCIIGDENSVLGTGTSAGSNVVRVGESRARESLGAAIRQACAAANISPSRIEKTCVGIAGGALPEVAGVVRRLVSEFVSGEVAVVGDMVIAMEAAFGGGPGVIVIAGTGSIAYGRNSAGQTARAGGWGFAISDEGSGHWIGRSAVAATMRAYDEAADVRSSGLLDNIMKSWGISSREQLVVAANKSPDFAALLPAVLSAADAGDATARIVLTHAGGELATLAGIVIARLFGKRRAVPVAVSGGVFGNSATVRQVFGKRVRAAYPHASLNTTVIDPVKGALALARKNAVL
ncbi:MAG TPA: BadF/BadG/BcrA/BcrD ATPase family protein [Terriglobales bacterium]|nr:BadF/BadG/BcrA/BcrD ATPase family protein [Terriglobales bacterium]